MNFMDAVKTCFNKYIDFSGRAPRSEYWWFAVFLIVGNAIAGWLDTAIFGTSTMMAGDMAFEYSMGVIGGLFYLATLLPGLAVAVRRLHDLDKSGWWVLIVMIPFIGFIILLVWFASKGTPGDNRFGPDPLG